MLTTDRTEGAGRDSADRIPGTSTAMRVQEKQERKTDANRCERDARIGGAISRPLSVHDQGWH